MITIGGGLDSVSTIITAQLFDAYLKCPLKCFRIFRGQSEKTNSYAEWLNLKEQKYYDAYLNNITRDCAADIYIFNPSFFPGLFKKKWRFLAGLVVHSQNLESMIHLIERSPSGELTPIRFTSANKLTKGNNLLVTLDSFVLAKMTGQKVKFGKIIHGDNYTSVKVKTSILYPKVRKYLLEIQILLSVTSMPQTVLKKHCIGCEFQILCNNEAIALDELSLIPNISEKERRKFIAKGILTVGHLSYTFRPRRKPKRLTDKPERYHHSLKALAIRQAKIYVAGNDKLRISGTPVYIDVEGIPDNDFYYLIGIRINAGEKVVQHSLWADSQVDEKKIWGKFLGILSGVSNPVIMHYGSFEVTFLKRMCKRYGEPQTNITVQHTIENPINLLGFIYSRVYFPTYSNGLKDIAKYLEFRWTNPEAKGINTIMWRKDWEQYKLPELKNNLILYNAEDCEALAYVTAFLKRLSERNNELDPSREIVNIDSLSDERLQKYHRVDFKIKALEEINRAAYWDYQHEKIQLKSNKELKKHATLFRNKITSKMNVDKVICWPSPTICPRCTCTKLYKYRKFTKNLIDVSFGKTSVRKCVVKYVFARYICTGCRATFCDTDPTWSRVKYGPNLMILTVYLNIYIGITQSRIAVLIKDVLGLNLTRNVINRFKARAAELYQPTYDNILAAIVGGTVVHVDETKVNLISKVGYIWTFTNTEYVSYIYSPSREAGLIQSILKDFEGVLVSDFYAAYDSMSCPQQKCLIHLIRDMNDDLIKEPFNKEIKLLIDDFANLLRNVVLTIEKFGLKTRYLRRHKVEVNRFFKKLSQTEYKTESATGWKKRLEKNRFKLFTFLDYDNVPWNNNNAEHAIKAIADLRRDLSGLSTEKGIKDYLTVLSVRETCKFKGIHFLEFLRSGEKDINSFASSKLSKKLKPHYNKLTII
jgi:predicted RecB family nuclease